MNRMPTVTPDIRQNVATSEADNGDFGRMMQRPMRSPLKELAERYSIEAAKLPDVLRNTVCRPDKNGRSPTDQELAAFCIVANQYRLNPFTREIYAFVSKGGAVVPIVGIDGWTSIVNRTGRFDGCEFVMEDGENGKPLSATCIMHVIGRSHPVRVTERYAECYRPTDPWNMMPYRMLRHKAFMQAARIAFSISGLFDEDEGRTIANTQSMSVLSADGLAERINALPANGNGGKLAPPAAQVIPSNVDPETGEEIAQPDETQETGNPVGESQVDPVEAHERWRVGAQDLHESMGGKLEEWKGVYTRWLLANRLKGKEHAATAEQRAAFIGALQSKSGIFAYLNR